MKKHTLEPVNISRTEFSNLIDEWVYNEKYRTILKRRYLDGIKFETIAEEQDMSVRQIKHIVYTVGDKLLLKIK